MSQARVRFLILFSVIFGAGQFLYSNCNGYFKTAEHSDTPSTSEQPSDTSNNSPPTDPQPPQNGSDPIAGSIFTANYNSDLGNFGNLIGLDNVRRQGRLPGIGPRGLDVFQIERLAVNLSEQYSGRNVFVAPFNAGTSRFFRWYEWHSPNNNYFNTTENGNSVLRGALRHKRLLIGNGQSAGQRMILNVNVYEDTGLPHIEAIFDSSPVISTGTFALNTWVAIQVEVRFGPNAYIKIWLNNDNFAAPTAELASGNYNQTDTDFVSFGMYTNNPLPLGGIHTWRDAGFRISSNFDNNWHGWLSNNN